ncbi:MAG: amidohydrolase [Spirochaetales bacterium]|nr:amidohydrolase [Spirochaetales bacterium]
MKPGKSDKADILLYGGTLYDPPSVGRSKAGVAIRGNIILAVGSPQDLEPLRDAKTTTFNLPDSLILPGFHDFHIHLFVGSLTGESVDLHEARSEEDCAARAAAFAGKHPDEQWIFGFNWYHVFWDTPRLPTRKSLDRLIPHRPVFLFNAEYHGAWVNSEALKVCGITRDTPDPPFGRIERDTAGEPTGFLYETAMGLVGSRALNIPAGRKEKLLKSFLQKAASLGVTSVHDMLPLPGFSCGDPEVYAAFEREHLLTLRVFLEADLASPLKEAEALRSRYRSPMLRFSGLKQFVDGVATTYTAFLVDPYSDRPGTRGGTLIPPDRLADWVRAADAGGFRLRLHTCGDAALRTALDCYEEARRKNGRRDSRHTVEHIETIHPEEYRRLKDLGVIASIQPEHLAMTERFDQSPYLKRLGPERERFLWPNRSLLNLGIPVCYGSDFPVVDLDPRKGLFRAVTRVHDDNNPPGGWTPDEKVSIQQALDCYTRAGAWGSFMEGSLGRLQPGFLADLTVLDKNLLPGNPEDILKYRVLLTISDGRIVYQNI